MQLGTIEGEVDTSSFRFRATEEVKKFDFVSVKSDDQWILAQVEEVTKNPEGETMANANIIGYRDKGLTKAPRRVIEPGSIVYAADQELISDTLGLEDQGLRIGTLETNDEIDIHVNQEDFYKHFAVLAQTGAGKCVTPETEVLKSDGSLVEIKRIFESSDSVIKSSEDEELRMLDNCSVKSIDEDYTQTDADALYAYRKKADKILRIKTSSGREIEVTPEHPLLSAEYDYDFVDSEELVEGDHIAVPREVDLKGSNQLELSETLKEEAEKESERRQERREKYEKFCKLDSQGLGLTRISEELSINKSTLENWKYQGSSPKLDKGFAVHQKAKGIQIPDSFSPEFAEFLSLIISEGAEQETGGIYRVIFTNDESRLMEKFVAQARSLFALETGEMRENARYADSNSLKYLLEDIGYRTLQDSRNKEIPDIILSSPEECRRKFLRVFFDAEGSMEDHEITLSSASYDIVNKISYMLLDFGIVTRIKELEKEARNSDHQGDIYYQISISSIDQLKKFSETIGFGIDRKQERLEDYIKGREGNTNCDVVPVDGKYLKAEREKLGLSQDELGEKIDSHSTLVSLYEREERRPSRENFEKMAGTLDSKLYRKLADSDVYWDRIESVEEVDYDGYVYDLTIRNHHNFIAGKGGVICHNSYTVGVLIEEMLEKDLPVMVIDPHGEYPSLKDPNPESEEPKGYDLTEYSPNTDINHEALKLSFSSRNIEKKELLEVIPDSLTNSQMGVLYNSLKRLREKSEDYNLKDVMDAVSQEESSAKWNLLNSMEQIDNSGLFQEDSMDLDNLIEPGEASVVNLKAVEPETAEMSMFLLAKRLFELRKRNEIPPFIMVIEEAHNFAPEKGFEQALSNKILRKIASEGRKFGLGLGVISQRPARIDKNVLSQCNTQFILRVTNPNDLKAISKSFEGVTSEVESMIKSLPPGVAFVLGNEYPVMTDVRIRRSRHGGETQTAENYSEKKQEEIFVPEVSLEELENRRGEKYDVAYYPLYETKDGESRILFDAVKGGKKAEVERLSDKEEDVVRLLSEDKDKSEILDELDINLSKLTSILDSLKSSGRVNENLEVKETVFDREIESRKIKADSIIEKEKTPEELGIDPERTVYYPYYSKGDQVFDPVLGEEI